MRLLLTILLVIMIFRRGLGNGISTVKDYSDICLNNKTIFIYLTAGFKTGGTNVAMFATTKKLQCKLKFWVRDTDFLMVVLQFPDWKPFENPCGSSGNIVSMVSNETSRNVCTEWRSDEHPIFHDLGKSSLGVVIFSNGKLNTVKITVTVMRGAPSSNCLPNTETGCMFNNKLYCMNSNILCDGNPNCGQAGKFDEDRRVCEGSKLSPKVIIYSIIMGILSFLIVLSILVNLMPKRKETFVYKFDQTMSLFDSEKGQISIEIKTKVIFPTELKPETFSLEKEFSEERKTLHWEEDENP